MDFYGQIDLTALCNAARQHPDLVKQVQKKDGTNHQYINININERREPDQNGRTHYIRVAVPKAQQKQGVNYYVADLKPSQQTAASVPATPAASQQPAPSSAPADGNATDDLPF